MVVDSIIFFLIKIECVKQRSKVKVGVLCPVQQPGLYSDRSSALSLVGVTPTQR